MSGAPTAVMQRFTRAGVLRRDGSPRRWMVVAVVAGTLVVAAPLMYRGLGLGTDPCATSPVAARAVSDLAVFTT